MNITQSIQNQYQAAFSMLENSIKDCSVSLWEDATYKNKYWHIVYHTLFYSHLYLSESNESFTFWEKHRKDYQYLNVVAKEAYLQEDVLEYLELCRKQIEDIAKLDLEAPAGFNWLPMNKYEMLIYNLRHIHHHTGQLIDRLREKANVSSNWVISNA